MRTREEHSEEKEDEEDNSSISNKDSEEGLEEGLVSPQNNGTSSAQIMEKDKQKELMNNQEKGLEVTFIDASTVQDHLHALEPLVEIRKDHEGQIPDTFRPPFNIWKARTSDVSSLDNTNRSSLDTDLERSFLSPLQTIDEEVIGTQLEEDHIDEEFPSILKGLSLGKRMGHPRKVARSSNYFDYVCKTRKKAPNRKSKTKRFKSNKDNSRSLKDPNATSKQQEHSTQLPKKHDLVNEILEVSELMGISINVDKEVARKIIRVNLGLEKDH